MGIIIQILINSILILFVAYMVKGVEVDDWWSAFVGALVLGLINTFLKPVLTWLTFPFTILSLGLSLLVINALLLMLMAALVKGVKVKGFMPALIGSVMLTVLNMVVSVFV